MCCGVVCVGKCVTAKQIGFLLISTVHMIVEWNVLPGGRLMAANRKEMVFIVRQRDLTFANHLLTSLSTINWEFGCCFRMRIDALREKNAPARNSNRITVISGILIRY